MSLQMALFHSFYQNDRMWTTGEGNGKPLQYLCLENHMEIFKSREVTLPTKACIVKAMVFPVVMYGCESWTIRTSEPWRTDAFKLSCWRRLLRVPWIARRPNLSILREISPKYALEWLMLKLKHQYYGYLMWRTDSLEKALMLGKMRARGERGDRRWDG